MQKQNVCNEHVHVATFYRKSLSPKNYSIIVQSLHVHVIGDTCKLLFSISFVILFILSIGSLTKDYFSAAFLGLRVECESVKQKEPSSQDEALDSANLARPKEGTKETATTCTAVTNDVAQTGVYIPTSDEIFRLIVMRRLQMVPPSSVQEFEDFNEYMSTVKGIITQDVMLGSLLITVKCRSLQVLEDLWTDYTSGLLNEIVQKCLVTDDVLNDLGLSELKLLTSMREAEYKACKQILQKSG